MRLKLVVYVWEGIKIIAGPLDEYRGPVGQWITLADSRMKLFGPHDPIPIDSPFACRINPAVGNPVFDYATGDPLGLEYPCFSIGWGNDWWIHRRFADTALYALTFQIEPGNLGVDYAAWDNVARGEGYPRALIPKGNTGSKDDAGDWIREEIENNPIRLEPWYPAEVHVVTGILPESPQPQPEAPAPTPEPPAWNPPPGARIMRGWLETGSTFDTFWTEDGRHWSALPS